MITEKLRQDYLLICEKNRRLIDRQTTLLQEIELLKRTNKKLSEKVAVLENDIEIWKKKSQVSDKNEEPETPSEETPSEIGLELDNTFVDTLVVENDVKVIEKPKKSNRKKKNTTEESLVDEPIITTDEQKEDNNNIE